MRKVERIQKTCHYCGIDIFVLPSRWRFHLKEKRNHIFCGMMCKIDWNKTQPGYWKGKKIPYYRRPNRDMKGAKNPRWKGGRRVDKSGYILIWKPDHPHCD